MKRRLPFPSDADIDPGTAEGDSALPGTGDAPALQLGFVNHVKAGLAKLGSVCGAVGQTIASFTAAFGIGADGDGQRHGESNHEHADDGEAAREHIHC
nr:hypothetical protein [Xaviernesmea rhizosphaerae]